MARIRKSSAASLLAEGGGEAALVADARGEPLVLQEPLERVKDLDAHPEGFAEASGAGRRQHEFLDVEAVVGMGAAVDHVHQRHRAGDARRGRRGTGRAAARASSAAARATARDTPSSALAPRPDLLGVPSSSSSARSIRACSPASMPSISGAIVSTTFWTARRTPLPVVAPGIVIAELDGLALARRGAGWHERAPERARREPDLDLDGGVATRVENLARVNVLDLGHRSGPALEDEASERADRLGAWPQNVQGRLCFVDQDPRLAREASIP